MSSIYQQEPPTTGKVILKTNYGDIEVELWCNETPRACRNFIQLCLEGYYDNTLFHRIIKDFMVQGGDPTATGKGGQSIYGGSFIDELHSRLKFSHRGIVAMANDGTSNSNLSQFFMTVDACPWLDRKHTIFGKVEGNTIYNLLKISELPTEKKTDYPICDPVPKILRVEVTVNPFEDIIPRNLSIKDKYESTERQDQQNKQTNQVQKQVIKPIKNKNLLSFNEDDEELEEPSTKQSKFSKPKIKSLHDTQHNDPTISKQTIVSEDLIQQQKKLKEQKEQAKDSLITAVKQQTNINQDNGKDDQIKQQPKDKQQSTIDELQQQMRMNMQQKKGIKDIDQELDKLDKNKKRRQRSRSRSQDDENATGTIGVVRDAIKRVQKNQKMRKRNQFATNKYDSSSDNDKESSQSQSEDDELETKYLTEYQKQSLQKTRDEYNTLKADLLQFKQTKTGTLLDDQNIDVQAKISALALQRQKYINQMKMTKNRENETLSKLRDFQSKIKSSKNDQQNWMNNKLQFQIDSQRAYDVNKGQQYASQNKFEEFITGGNQNKKYQQAYSNVKKPDLGDDVVHGMNLEERVSMNELLELATKSKDIVSLQDNQNEVE